MQPSPDSKSNSPTPEQIRQKQMLGIALLILLVGGGAALGWWKWHTPTIDEPLVDVPGSRFGTTFRMPSPPVARDGIRKTGTGYEVRSGDARMSAWQSKDGEWKYAWRYQPDKNASLPEHELLTAKYRASMLQLTDDQKKKLDALTYVGGMAVSESDQAKLKDEFQAYQSAGDSEKPAKEATLAKSLADIAATSAEATRAAFLAYTAQVKAILTPDQITKLAQDRAAPGGTPVRGGTTGAPTTAPVR